MAKFIWKVKKKRKKDKRQSVLEFTGSRPLSLLFLSRCGRLSSWERSWKSVQRGRENTPSTPWVGGYPQPPGVRLYCTKDLLWRRRDTPSNIHKWLSCIFFFLSNCDFTFPKFPFRWTHWSHMVLFLILLLPNKEIVLSHVLSSLNVLIGIRLVYLFLFNGSKPCWLYIFVLVQNKQMEALRRPKW